MAAVSSKLSAVFWIFNGSNPNLRKPGGFFPSSATLLCQLRAPLFVVGSYEQSHGNAWLTDLHQKMAFKGKVLWKIQIFAEKKWQTQTAQQKWGPPNSQNATFLTLDIQKLTEKVFVSPQNIPKNTFSAGIWMYRVRLVFLVLTHLRPDVVMLLQVAKVSPSSETVITWRQQWPKEEEENSRGLPNQTNGHNPTAIQPNKANPTKNYGP